MLINVSSLPHNEGAFVIKLRLLSPKQFAEKFPYANRLNNTVCLLRIKCMISISFITK